MERKIHFRENRPIVWGIWGEAELILRIWGAKENTFRELRNFYHQCIIFRDQWSTTPPPPLGGLEDENIFYYVALLCIVLDN